MLRSDVCLIAASITRCSESCRFVELFPLYSDRLILRRVDEILSLNGQTRKLFAISMIHEFDLPLIMFFGVFLNSGPNFALFATLDFTLTSTIFFECTPIQRTTPERRKIRAFAKCRPRKKHANSRYFRSSCSKLVLSCSFCTAPSVPVKRPIGRSDGARCKVP